jgi:hypothetical protein
MPSPVTPIIVPYTGKPVTYIVPATGEYQVTADGAGGGAGSRNQPGGLGAEATGNFVFVAGTHLGFVVGQAGGAGDIGDAADGGGGGGGTFLTETYNGTQAVNEPLLIAGGGGGSYGGGTPTQPTSQQGDGINGQTGPSGAAGFSNPRGYSGGAGGTNGDGGQGGSGGYAGGGGGVSGGAPGGFFVSGSAGGSLANLNLANPNFQGGAGFAGGGNGGFGGGGGASGGGGGGGGYGGGGGGVIYAGGQIKITDPFFSGRGGGGGSLDTGSNASVIAKGAGNGSLTLALTTTAQPATSVGNDGVQDYVMVLPESGAVTVAGAQFITTDTGAKLVDTSSGDPVIAVGMGNSTLIGGGGNSNVVAEGGNDIYGFLNGHAGGQEDIYNFNSSDQLAFGGYTGDPIRTETVGATGDLIQLTDGTIINLVGVNHTVFS